MKTIANLISVLVIFFSINCIPLSVADANTVPGGKAAPESVTMPWDTFMEIWDKYREPDMERSRLYAYEGALYEGRAHVEKNKYYLKFKATFKIVSFSRHKQLVPVISTQLSPEKMLLNSTPTGYIKKPGYYHIILPKKGNYTVTSFFTITLDAQRWPRNFNLPLVPIAKSNVRLNVIDTDIEARFEPGVVVKTVKSNQSGKGDQIRGIVPAVHNTSIRWLKRSQKREMIPLKMGAVVHSYVSLAENGATIKSEVAFQVLQGETHYFQIQVPKTIDILDVTAIGGEEKISQWYAQDMENGRMIHIYASYRHKTKFAVRLHCERTVTRTNYRFTIPHIVPQEVERYENLIAVGSEANVEISESDVERSEGRDVRFVPEEIQAFAKGRSLFYYKVLDNAFKLAFDIKSHEKATVVKTRIEHIEADSVVTDVGTVMTKATYKVKNNQAQFLKLKLPESSKLLSAFTNGREIQPVVDQETLLIPLDKSTNASFPVEIAWLSKIDGFSTVGQRSVLLPFSPISTGELSWRLYTPEKYQIFHFGGNVELGTSTFSSTLRRVLSELSQGQVQTAFAGGGTSSKSYNYNVESVRKRFKKGKKHYDKSFDFGASGSQVQVQIPVTGNVYRFSSYLIKGFTPKISFCYMSETLHQIVGFFYGVLTFFIVFSVSGSILNRSEYVSYFPAKRAYWLSVIAIILLLGLTIIILKLGVFAKVLEGTGIAIIFFAFWQNRQESRKFHTWATGLHAYFPEALLGLYVLLVVIPALLNELGVAVFFSIASICFHASVFRALKLISDNKKKKTETMSSVTLLFSILIVLSIFPALSWSSASGEIESNQTTQNMVSQKEQAQVKLAWPTVEHMLKTIEDRENRIEKEPKAGYLFGTVQIDGEITEKYASLRINVPLRLISDSYVKVPLVSSTTPIAKALYNKKPLALFKGIHYVYFEAGKETERNGILQIHLSAPVREKGGVKEFMVRSPLLQGGAVELRFGTDIKSVKLYNVAWEKRKGRVIKAALGNAQELRGELATFVRKQETADEADKRVKKRYATTYTLVSLEDEIVTYYSSIRYRILNEHVREFAFKLPESVIVHEIVGEDMEGWQVKKGNDGMNTYSVKVMYPVADRYDLSVRFETPVPEGNKAFVIPCLLVESVARDTGYIGIEMQGRGEIAIEKLDKARQIDIRELPSIIRTDSSAPFVYAFRYIERPYNISFNIRKHKGLQMDPAIADRIDYTRVLSPHGTLLSQARIWIRNSRKQYVTFHLPEGAKIISTFLDGKSVKPSINEKGLLLLPLKRQSVAPFVLDVVFEDADVNFSNTGSRILLDYPRVDVPVSTVTSTIYVPKNMRVFEPDGNFQETTHVNYVRWASHTASDTFEANQQLQIDMPRNTLSNAFIDNQTRGINSLKINIPKYGQQIALNAFYIPSGEPLQTSFFMMHSYLFRFGSVMAFLVCVVIGGSFKQYFKRPLYWVVAILSLIVFYYKILFSWKVILFGIISGYVTLHIIAWMMTKRRNAA